MRPQNFHDRPAEVDLAPRWAAAFIIAMALMSMAYALIHYLALNERVSAGHSRPATHVIDQSLG